MRSDEEIFDEKRQFVTDKLTPFLQAIDQDIESAEYHVITHTPYDLEYIVITWKGGSSKRAYVTGDSLVALAKDVLKVIS
ncbi:MAG: hypothetical protein IKH96_04745 [Ruminococcus sp.]|uniref:hypothetical protein n=1 Tax=Ruminococcus sp. TaxID=41978 RepID=UPI0025D4C698|nr:hypothetical protein [Ruminococcus sp.]MBR6995311.1 hypothetical protein [Ruminococcus sp.]